MIGRKRTGAAVAVAAVTLLAGCDLFDGGQARYESPDQASAALLAAVSSGETSAMLRVLGEDALPLVESGDAIEDANRRNEFVALYGAAHRWESEAADVSTLIVGPDDWPSSKNVMAGAGSIPRTASRMRNRSSGASSAQ